jgi:alpha-amylase/alpha-mannosidase (GH57 family)
MKRPSVVIHSHFYQPPREDPRSDRVPVEPSASPFHDWNERVHAECYAPVTAARVLDGDGHIRAVVNTLEWMSWDAGPTLLRWLAREEPATYYAFLTADARSLGRLGRGNALAAPYHHVILPLASRRDKVTEVRWGIADFRRRFGREPEGMWLPETAVDTETLEVLAQEGIRFTVLAPEQVEAPPSGGLPGRVRLGGSREIAVFVYDGPISHGVAFGSLLRSADTWIGRLRESASETGTRLVSLATDGETFGHHHRWSDMALAATLWGLEGNRALRLENYASFLGHTPPVEDVTLVEPSSWSCVHGVDRWRRECGCKMAPQLESQQAWRGVLREALDELAEELHALYRLDGGRLLRDVWEARDEYGATLDAGEERLRRFVHAHAARTLTTGEVDRALELLAMEHDALRMFTSCGWFFDDLAGLEPLQVLRYAAHAVDLAGKAAAPWEARLRDQLSKAQSNDPKAGNGRRLWDERIRNGPATDPAATAAAGPQPEPELLRALRTFLRAPGSEAARGVLAGVDAIRDRSDPVLLTAQSVFARQAARDPAETSAAVRSVAKALGFGPSFFAPRAVGGKEAVGFVFGLHLHQPVGNFDEVFRQHTQDVYLPFLEKLSERGLLPVTLHVSGPLLEWLDRHGHRFLDLVGRLASAGEVELLASGFYEPVLAALTRDERVEQIGWMREWLARRFGVDATGLWLTERVWEPDLVLDLAEAGVRHALVDDRHFLVAGLERHRLHRPHRTESGGQILSLLPIDERLRYLVPFRPPEELADYLHALRAEDHSLAVLADDGEKFGGWPGTAKWVWESGWIDRFTDTMTALLEDGALRMLTASQAVESVPADGPSYLPSASYREMEAWALPPAASLALESLEDTIEGAPIDHAARRFVRGGHWRNFFAVYPESHRMHRKVQLLSELCRRAGDPPKARRAIARATCNDAYWHGVFGGLYLRHLRAAIWATLSEAEEILRQGEGLLLEVVDVDGDGTPELWAHSAAFSCVVSPARGGAVTELTRFADRRDLADVLTRRWEAYHKVARGQRDVAPATPDGGMPSIHDLEAGLGFEELPPFDAEARTLTVERVLSSDLTAERFERAEYDPLHTWAHTPMGFEYDVSAERVEIRLEASGLRLLSKLVLIAPNGAVELRYRWDPAAFPSDARFAPELSLSADVPVTFQPTPDVVWRYDIRTVSKSESGAEETTQGHSVTPIWPCRIGEASVLIP